MLHINRWSSLFMALALAILLVAGGGAVFAIQELHQRNDQLAKDLGAVSAQVNRLTTQELQEASRPKLVFLHAILRPDSNGRWYVQNDVDHASHGLHPENNVQLIQTEKSLKIYFDKRYAKAGVIQITMDDGFAGAIIANASLGLEVAEISLRAYPNIAPSTAPINPRKIWKYAPNKDNGNLWVSIVMIDSPQAN